MTVLVFGVSGLLGSNVVEAARQRGRDVVGTYHTTEPAFDIDCRQCDITEPKQLQAVIEKWNPTCVINCAAMTDVDSCEQNPDAAMAVNATAPERIAQRCAERGIRFVHVSTDYVFDGDQQRPYRVDDEMAPIQEYGRSKQAGEQAVIATQPSALVVRLSFVYGIHQSSGTLTGLPAWIVEELQAGTELPLFTDQYVTPTRAGQAAETICELVAADGRGRFHVACRDCVTPYEIGKRIAQRLDRTEKITEGRRADVDRRAPRPAATCLDVQKTEQYLDRPQPTLDAELDQLNLDQS